MRKKFKIFVFMGLWLFFLATMGLASTNFTLSSIVKPGETGTRTFTTVIKDIEKPTNVVLNGESLKRRERDSNGNPLSSWDTLITKYTVNGYTFGGNSGNHTVMTIFAEVNLTITVEATSHSISWGSKGPSDDAGEYSASLSITLVEQ